MVLIRTMDRLKALSITSKLDNTHQYEAEVNLSSVEFADDCTGVTVCDTEDQVQTSLEITSQEYRKYFSANGLKINILKSEHIVFGYPRTKLIYVEGRKEADKVKLLGLTVNKSYKFDDHVDNITEKISKRNGQLSKIAGFAGKDTLKMLANATIQSVALYGSAINAKDKGCINRVQKKLNKTMRLVTSSKMSTHVADMIRDLNWLKFELNVAYNKVMLLNRILTHAASPYCMQLVTAASRQTRYLVRERDLRIAWRPKFERKGGNSFIVTAVRLYNQVKILGKVMKPASMSKFVKEKIKSWKSI